MRAGANLPPIPYPVTLGPLGVDAVGAVHYGVRTISIRWVGAEQTNHYRVLSKWKLW